MMIRLHVALFIVVSCLLVTTFVPLVADEPTATVAKPEQEEQQTTEPARLSPAPLPPALTHYMDREIAVTMHFTGAPWLVRESREREEECSTLLKVLKLKPGQIVCDLGCGNGFYALKMAPQVAPQGKILGVDIQPEMLQLLRERSRVLDIDNIEPVLGTLIDPKLPAGKVDLVLCVDAYHEFSHPVHMLREIRKSLAPNGRLVLVEFRAEDPKVPIKPLHKMSKKQVLKELVPNGYKLVEEFDELPWQHVMFFGRDEEWVDPEQQPESRSPAKSAADATEENTDRKRSGN